jgi:hypothetical protein
MNFIVAGRSAEQSILNDIGDIRRLRFLGRDLDYAIVSRVHGGIIQLECSTDVGSIGRVASGRVVHGGFRERGSGGPWHVTFEVAKGDGTEIAHSAFAIFNSVFQAVAEFIEIREPETLVFATKRDELANIYQTYLCKWSARIEELGYRLEGPVRVDPYTEFMLTRVEPSGWKD